jgi:site-specific recombinase XerD
MNDRKLGPSSLIVTAAALRFLYKVTLHREWNVEDRIPVPKRPQKLPIVLSPEEVLRFLDSVSSLKYRTILTTCYAAGLQMGPSGQSA